MKDVNINIDIGLANGTPFRYHSLSFATDCLERLFIHRVQQAMPGDVIDLNVPPVAVNIELFPDTDGDNDRTRMKNQKKRKAWKHDKLSMSHGDDRVVIPIAPHNSTKEKKKPFGEEGLGTLAGCTGLLLLL